MAVGKTYRGSELEEQIKVLNWARYIATDERLELLHHIPNGGWRGHNEAKMLKASGVLAGIPDLFLPVACGNYHGLYIEMKKVGGKLSSQQKTLITLLRNQGYKVEICYGYEQAIATISDYLATL